MAILEPLLSRMFRVKVLRMEGKTRGGEGSEGKRRGGQGEQREEEEMTRGGQGERGEEKRSNKVKYAVRISYFLVT